MVNGTYQLAIGNTHGPLLDSQTFCLRLETLTQEDLNMKTSLLRIALGIRGQND